MIQIDMQMPEGCSECRFETECGFCKAMPDDFCGYTNDEGKPEWCPLKEQKAVAPQLSISGMWYECPVCHRHLTKNNDNYCARCGRPVKWG